MYSLRKVTLLVTLMALTYPAHSRSVRKVYASRHSQKIRRTTPTPSPARLALPQAPPKAKAAPLPLSLSFRVAGVRTMLSQNNPTAAVGANLEYNFYSSYALGFDYSYLRPFSVFDDYVNNGMNDTSIYISDRALYTHEWARIKISARVGVLLPTSSDSRAASLRYGLTGGLTFKKGFSSRLSVTYALRGTDYDHRYATAEETAEKTVYNTRFDLNNKITLAYDLLRQLRFETGGAITTFNDYADSTFNVYTLGAAFIFDMAKFAKLDLGVRSNVKNPEDHETWNMPAVSGRFFDAAGTQVYMGLTLDI